MPDPRNMSTKPFGFFCAIPAGYMAKNQNTTANVRPGLKNLAFAAKLQQLETTKIPHQAPLVRDFLILCVLEAIQNLIGPIALQTRQGFVNAVELFNIQANDLFDSLQLPIVHGVNAGANV
jgi:hypothetical protein